MLSKPPAYDPEFDIDGAWVPSIDSIVALVDLKKDVSPEGPPMPQIRLSAWKGIAKKFQKKRELDDRIGTKAGFMDGRIPSETHYIQNNSNQCS